LSEREILWSKLRQRTDRTTKKLTGAPTVAVPLSERVVACRVLTNVAGAYAGKGHQVLSVQQGSRLFYSRKQLAQGKEGGV